MLAEEQKNTRKALLFIFGSIGIIVLLIFFGIPALAKITSFLTGLKKTASVSENSNLPPPAPPVFESLPEATNKTPLQISGSVQPGNTVVINFNGQEVEMAVKDNGNFSFNQDLTKGTNTLYALAKGPTGTLSQKSTVYTVVFDNEAPTIQITSPQDGAKFYGAKQQNITIKGTTEAGASLTINERLVSVAEDGSFTSSYSLTEGENNLVLKALDQAGNATDSSLKLYFSP